MTRLTVERVFSDPPLSGSVPGAPKILPSGNWVLYLANPPDARERLDLYGYHVQSKKIERLVDASTLAREGELTTAEKAQRERLRQFTFGITTFVVYPSGDRVAFLAAGAVYTLDIGRSQPVRVTPDDARQTDLQVSGTGRYLSYVRGADLYVFDCESGTEQRITFDGSTTIENGVADFIAQEEMHRYTGHWWSPDDAQLVYTRSDTGHIPIAHRYEFQAGTLTVHDQRYPYAGGPNAEVSLRVRNLATGTECELPWADDPQDYLARVTVSNRVIAVQVQSRDQQRLALAFFERGDFSRRNALEESSHTWIDLHDNLRFQADGQQFLWTSERAGNSRLYLYGASRTPLELTRSGRVVRVVHADAASATFLGWHDDPTQMHLYRVRFDRPCEVVQLTRTQGWHDAIVASDGSWFVDRVASVDAPPSLARIVVDDDHREWIVANRLDDDHPYAPYRAHHAAPKFGTLTAADGQRLHYRMTLPHDFDAHRCYPAVIHVYGGPGVQRVVNDWPPLTLQLFAQAGFVVFELDNRGSGNRERQFQDSIYGQLGRVEVEDQLLGLEHLRAQSWIDGSRIAFFGHSYGGYMTLMCLAAAGSRARAGVSVAPVTDWSLYDTHYTERYLSTPHTNPDGYARSAVLPHLGGIAGRLLLMHGMADDNVLFDNSSLLMRELQRRRVPFELMLYPGAKHALQERDVAIHRFDTIIDFLERTLA